MDIMDTSLLLLHILMPKLLVLNPSQLVVFLIMIEPSDLLGCFGPLLIIDLLMLGLLPALFLLLLYKSIILSLFDLSLFPILQVLPGLGLHFGFISIHVLSLQSDLFQFLLQSIFLVSLVTLVISYLLLHFHYLVLSPSLLSLLSLVLFVLLPLPFSLVLIFSSLPLFLDDLYLVL